MPDKTGCKVDADCVPAACCHNSAAVNKEYAPDCQDMSCTGECKKPYDCGCSEILCIEKKCTLQIKESMKENPLCGGTQSFY